MGLRLGLCCKFLDAPIHFRTTTAAYCSRLKDPRAHLETIILDNIEALFASINYCSAHQFGSFRISSGFLPLITHPDYYYSFESLSDATHTGLEKCRTLAEEKDIRLTFHPDQFVVINSLRPEVVEKSLQELEWHGALASALGADVINIHGGGAFGDKDAALRRFIENAHRLSAPVLERLTLENDDKIYTPQDLLPICLELEIPLVYDVHHHRCLPDELSIEEATAKALATWNREPLFHISSPLEGWAGPTPRRHHDYIAIEDFPSLWKSLDLTVEVEAKAKERALERLRRDLN